MVKMRNFAEAEAALAGYIPAVKIFTGQDKSLERMQPLLEKLGNPQDKLRIIHIAGTSGKTSTAYYLAGMLQATGKKIGLTVSPHIDVVSERVQINGQPLSEAEFCHALSEFLEVIAGVQPEPMYFEVLTAFAYWYFACHGVDYAVVETGFGGLYDATNVAQQPNKICVITDIGYDHTHILGKTLPLIAAQKAGIIHAGNRAFMYEQAPEVMRAFTDRATKQGAQLKTFQQDQLTERYAAGDFAGMPLFQQRNWLLARAVYDYVAQQDSLSAQPNHLLNTEHIQIPGRMDVVQVGGQAIVMDGAHNQQKMAAFVASYQKKYPNTKATIILSMKQGKEVVSVLPLLKPICRRLIITSFEGLNNLPSAATAPDILAALARRQCFTAVQTMAEPLAAYQLAHQSKDDIIITGSFYLVARLRPFILEA